MGKRIWRYPVHCPPVALEVISKQVLGESLPDLEPGCWTHWRPIPWQNCRRWVLGSWLGAWGPEKRLRLQLPGPKVTLYSLPFGAPRL